MRRRLIPPLIASIVLGIGAALTFTEVLSDETADLGLLGFCAIVFAFKFALFVWMRQRMRNNIKGLTVFGLAITDWFLSLAILAAVLTYVFAQLWWIGTSGSAQDGGPLVSEELRKINRSLIAVSGMLVVLTGGAVAYEMRKAGENLSVHKESEEMTTLRAKEMYSD